MFCVGVRSTIHQHAKGRLDQVNTSIMMTEAPPPHLLRQRREMCTRTNVTKERRRQRSPSLLSFTLLLVAVIKCQHYVAHASTANPSLSATPATATIRNDTTPAHTSFLDKFESRGPTLTVTLRDPSTTALIGSSSGSDRNSKSNLISKLQQYRDAQRQVPEADGTFGISSKLAALFHITPSTAVISGQNNMASKQFADGYMLDGGEVLLGPPSETAREGVLTTGNLFPLSGLVGGLTKWSRHWSECLSNVHPEMRYEIMTRQSLSSTNDAGGSATKPFSSLPWLSSASCGIAWRPFPVRKSAEEHGINSPHYFRCCASLSLPRISNLWKIFTSDKQVRLKARDLDVGLTYRDDSISSSTGMPAVEILFGRTRPSLPPPNFCGSTARIKSILKSDKYRRNNHLMVRLATGDEKGRKSGSTIEYTRFSLRLSTPSFLRRFRNKRGKGVTVMPSYDFIEGKARCVLSGDVGSTGRTRAVLRLDVDDSTLTLVRALEGNKIIAPTISLQSGKIVYDYHIDLEDGESPTSHQKVGSSLRAHVDPSKGVILKWTDGIPGGSGGSCWVTECRVPLGVTAAGPLSADVRVGRRWVM